MAYWKHTLLCPFDIFILLRNFFSKYTVTMMSFGSFTKSNNEDIAAAFPEICYLIISLS